MHEARSLFFYFIIADNAGCVTVVHPTPMTAPGYQKAQCFPRIALNGADARRGARTSNARLRAYVLRIAVLLLAAAPGAASQATTTARIMAEARETAAVVVDLLHESGGSAPALIYPDFGHYIPVEVRARVIDPFIDRVLRDPGA
jgi:hypothetical protein